MTTPNPSELPSDLCDVAGEVAGLADRLLALQDKDPDSPFRGCMHPAYWRDKSSEVADMRRQEAALAFAWLWAHDFPENQRRGSTNLLHASLRALGFWTRGQHRDGTFDEWYKNEHGYATTAFSSFAVALALPTLRPHLKAPLAESVRKTLARAGQWLATHDDWFKTNHQAVGVAALAAVGTELKDDGLLAAARRNATRIVERMDSEGWSREISGLDIGYTFLLAEYLAMHAVITGETTFLPAITKAYRFAASFLHPELITGAEYGICANPYFCRAGTVALAPHDGVAAGVLAWMRRPSALPRDTSPTLKDDLRLARYAYQPLLAYLLSNGVFPRKDLPKIAVLPEPLLFQLENETRWYSHAKLLALGRRDYAAYAAPAHGGLLRAFFRHEDGFHPGVVDRGYVHDDGRTILRNARYSLDVETQFEDGTLRILAPLVKAAFVIPPYWARVALTTATALPFGHKWTRKLIDVWRKKKGTALNQSTAGISGGRSHLSLERKLQFLPDTILIEDTLRSSVGPLDPTKLHLVLDGPLQLESGLAANEDQRIALAELIPNLGSSTTIRLQKTISLKNRVATLTVVPASGS